MVDDDLRVAIERISVALDALKIDPKMRGRLRSRAMNLLCRTVRECADEATKTAFADAMYRAGYHRPW